MSTPPLTRHVKSKPLNYATFTPRGVGAPTQFSKVLDADPSLALDTDRYMQSVTHDVVRDHDEPIEELNLKEML